MIETRGVRRARELAEHWHRDQFDKIGMPYTSHLRAVAARTDEMAAGARCRSTAVVAAWLHDVLEDTAVPWMIAMEAAGPAGPAVMALSHLPGEPLRDYFRRIAAVGIVPAIVKWADIEHNSSPFRQAGLRVHHPDVWARQTDRLPLKLATFAQAMADADLIGPWSNAANLVRLIDGVQAP